MHLKFIKDILFPVFCVECSAEGAFWCESCRAKRRHYLVARCPGCGKSNAGELCNHCCGFSYLDYSFAFLEYREKDPVAKLISDYKYNFAQDIAEVWQEIIGSTIKGLPLPDSAAVVPVPLFARRERERGFNQAEIIAEIICMQIKKYFPERKYCLNDRLLFRERPTAQQAKLSKTERETNVRDAFVLKSGSTDETVMLVDDVYTTGATLNECARVLKTAGAKTIYAVTLARAI